MHAAVIHIRDHLWLLEPKQSQRKRDVISILLTGTAVLTLIIEEMVDL